MKKILIATVLSVVLGIGLVYAQDYIEETDLTQIAVKTVLDFDNLVILPTTKTCVIRTIIKELDASNNVVSQRAGKKFIYMNVVDNLETEEDETCNDFNVFMQKLGINKAVVKQAIREMETE